MTTKEYIKQKECYAGSPSIFGVKSRCNIWIRYDFLKNGKWVYYDEKGKIIKNEDFIDGALIFIIE